MKKILVTGAAGQIGQELVPVLRKQYGNDNVVAAASGLKTPLPEGIIKSGPSTVIDVTDYIQLERAINRYGIDTIYHMSSILSKTAEENPELAYDVNVNGLLNVLRAARGNKLERVIIPSSIAAFGPHTPKANTPNDTVQKPKSIYGQTKVVQEMLADIYSEYLGLDIRGVRFPGLLTWTTPPNPAGTTDYANYMIFDAIRKGLYLEVPLKGDTMLPFMYMPDAIKALIDLAEADRGRLTHHGDYNVTAYSFTPLELAQVIKKVGPEFGIINFEIGFKLDPVRQKIADSWVWSMDDSLARKEWGWKPDWDLESTVRDMLKNLKRKLMGEIKVSPV
ncbi:NAD-dependent epimerase/dehydratase family protein [Candidatus Woesearchaeota archaeon]|nr:NAD-dependent epimerase/dehydratase family protein [Candidatus Woesearchaeota archaeon]